VSNLKTGEDKRSRILKAAVSVFPDFDSLSAINPDKMGIFRTKFVHFRTTNNPLNVKG
jgi:hypothetical protein